MINAEIGTILVFAAGALVGIKLIQDQLLLPVVFVGAGPITPTNRGITPAAPKKKTPAGVTGSARRPVSVKPKLKTRGSGKATPGAGSGPKATPKKKQSVARLTPAQIAIYRRRRHRIIRLWQAWFRRRVIAKLRQQGQLTRTLGTVGGGITTGLGASPNTGSLGNALGVPEPGYAKSSQFVTKLSKCRTKACRDKLIHEFNAEYEADLRASENYGAGLGRGTSGYELVTS